VRYLFNAAGIVLLIDPGGLAVLGRPLVSKVDRVPLTTRAVIDGLADAIEDGHRAALQRAVADDRDHPGQGRLGGPVGRRLAATRVAGARRRQADLHHRDARQAPRGFRALPAAFISLGGRSLVEAAETRFDKRKVFYSAISATNEQPFEDHWNAPTPVACSIPLAHILLPEL